jgi:hypothetical protein
MSFPSLRLLDQVQHLSQLESFDQAAFLDAVAADVSSLAGETLSAVGEELDALRGFFDPIDRFAEKDMNIRLTQSLGADPLPRELRLLLRSTILSYTRDLPLLQGRVGAALARIDRHTAAEVTDRVMAAARSVLETCASLRNGVLVLAQRTAAARLPLAQKAAANRSLPTGDRQKWGQARVDLERLSANGEVLLAGSFSERLARIEPPPDEPEPESEGKRFSLLEID